jgi:hypothetical protein
LAKVWYDKELRDLAEADFQSEYQIDLYDVRKKGGLSTVKASRLLWQLPVESRLRQHLPEEKEMWTRRDHQIQDQIDLLQLILYYASVDATVKEGLKRSDIQKIHRQAPKRVRRPGEPKPTYKFLSGKELKKTMFRGGSIPNPKGYKEKGG